MSKLLNLFGSKNKNNKSMKSNSENLTNEKNKYHEDDNPAPILARKTSLTKSGRMKERKRKNISVSDYFPESDKVAQSPEKNDENCDPDEVFSVEEVVREMHQIGRMEITAL
ncbi:hypothetical protein TcasGA2_TC012409 [Tribolium castaneum]|uniref:Uncharacterized protein n=1 Tax=Tribolium castaneum TaxID=7070 RepID=D6X247_TRICA|nr:hypothetical protein TcasGA2_TC012409 [Tribolium castaneum]